MNTQKVPGCRQSRTAAAAAAGTIRIRQRPSRFSSNSTTGVSDVTSIWPSTMAPLAMAIVRA